MDTKTKLFIVGAITLLGIFAGGNIVSAQTVVTTCNSATIYGTVTPNGNPTSAWFEWGLTPSLGNSTTHQTFNSNSTFSQMISGLTENTTYYYRAMAQNNYGTATGDTKSFTTSTCPVSTYIVDTNVTSGNGSFSPPSRTVTSGNTTSFNLIPGSGYSIGSASGCGGYLSGNVYNTGAITSNCTVSASFNAVPNPVVTTPIGLSAYAISSSQINSSWNPSTGGNGSQIAYNIYRCTGAGCTANQYIDWGYPTSYSDSGLTCNTTYGYRVRAYDSTPTFSGYSNTAYATTF
ncbi:MAG: fibronectin type III domain-containing protein, partial [Candidatus Nomurabacteria bacterium]|nr:fibronectin type III domain-containing protein [Candidatus Nomurabacteria bacterium]